ncbi:hypothetical protein WOSG25_190080 [Weissella oryzae SG25]|uniref:Uncharacterized protein n=1 Tax=Weissella oryzae (strain DSM 25784 / JCM 18191 / LMG 30913 / SG25) TaxID=1329250 RepID=A0A069CVT3_WEIOS|nr:hypothetical protein [Weissella oryzae]GAK31900.1 hypothetical protein WOSG25_190080 [Weissella oryzae SG25]
MLEEKKSLKKFYERVNGGKQPKRYAFRFSSTGDKELSFWARGERFVYSFDFDDNGEFTNFRLIDNEDLEGPSQVLMEHLLSN